MSHKNSPIKNFCNKYQFAKKVFSRSLFTNCIQ
ncbi:hypothetical protein TDE_1902 [Treponema denticola ATCC 35405]|uniref:Uncharacterized protein n=1 Tax=Treponema denticola (strain ATCC 35405 / DSM 14222 / CIP 103919 / JCM 8153 / KCTC 15104) TaxID=243275 RepID=Q73LG2_TREDE|nr:hypothetical protein TDE_1902 [Treponema denticola ATCC 35405]